MRKFICISEQDFKDKLVVRLKELTEADDESWDEYIIPEEKTEGWEASRFVGELSSAVKKDLAKVEVDWENYGSIEPSCPDDDDQYFGIHTLQSGLTYLGYYAGGDWESPVFFIIYWDNGFRGFVPKDGNPWNRTTKQAFGNDSVSDLADQIKHFGLSKGSEYTQLLDWDWTLIFNEINNHFEERK